MEDALSRLPHALDDAFAKTIDRVQRQPGGQRELSMNTLMWLTHARRPLTYAQLSDALAIQRDTTSVNAKFRPSKKRIIDSGLGLVTIDEKSSVVRLVHYSVREYLLKQSRSLFPNSEITIAEKCLTYLSFEPFSVGPRHNKSELVDLISRNPFVEYAAPQWGSHLRLAQCKDVERLALKWLRSGPHRSCACQVLYYLKKYREEYWKPDTANSHQGLHLAASFGLITIGKQLLEAGDSNVDECTAIGTTALIKAAAGGYADFVDMLLEAGADALKENWYGTALHCAAEAGKVSTIDKLLDYGVDVNVRDRRGRTALHCATVSGHKGAIKKLLERKADVNAICTRTYTALRYAIVWQPSEEIFRLLLEQGADTETRAHGSLTALHDAVDMNSLAMVDLLLEYGAKVHTVVNQGSTALHYAAEQDYVEILKALLNHGADKDQPNDDGLTPLHFAAGMGCTESVKVLMAAGARIEAADNEGLSPLGVAIREGHQEVTTLLQNAGASIHEDKSSHPTPSSKAEQSDPKEAESAAALTLSDKDRNSDQKKQASIEPRHFTGKGVYSVCPKAGCNHILVGWPSTIQSHFQVEHNEELAGLELTFRDAFSFPEENATSSSGAVTAGQYDRTVDCHREEYHRRGQLQARYRLSRNSRGDDYRKKRLSHYDPTPTCPPYRCLLKSCDYKNIDEEQRNLHVENEHEYVRIDNAVASEGSVTALADSVSDLSMRRISEPAKSMAMSGISIGP